MLVCFKTETRENIFWRTKTASDTENPGEASKQKQNQPYEWLMVVST